MGYSEDEDIDPVLETSVDAIIAQGRRIQRLESGLRQALAVISANGVYQNAALRPLIDDLHAVLDDKPE